MKKTEAFDGKYVQVENKRLTIIVGPGPLKILKILMKWNFELN